MMGVEKGLLVIHAGEAVERRLSLNSADASMGQWSTMGNE